MLPGRTAQGKRIWSRGRGWDRTGEEGRPGWGGDGGGWWGWGLNPLQELSEPFTRDLQGLSSLMKSIISANVSQQFSKVREEAARDGQEREEVIS